MSIMVTDDGDFCTLGKEVRNMLEVALAVSQQEVMIRVFRSDGKSVFQTLSHQILKRLTIG